MRREFVISVLLVSMIIYAGYTLDTTSSKQVSVDICHEAPITEDLDSVNPLYHRIAGIKIQSLKSQGFDIICVTDDSYVKARDVLDLVSVKDSTLYYKKVNNVK